MNANNTKIAQSDLEILETFVKGDGDGAQCAFGLLVQRYERLVWTVCRNQLSNRCDVEDAFQVTFLVLATQAHRITRPESLASWLYGVAWKTSARMREKRRKEMVLELDDQLVSAAETPFQIISRRFQVESMDRQLREMEDKYRTPLVLFYFANLSAREIAQRMGISVSAVEGRLRRGKAKLRVAMVSQGVVFSPAMMGVVLMSSFRSDPALIAATCERFMSTTNGLASVAWSGAAKPLIFAQLSTGTKLMILKSFLWIALSGMMLIGYLHGPGMKTEHQSATEIQVDVSSPMDERSGVVIAAQEQDADDEERSPDEPTLPGDSLHHHLRKLHDRWLNHAHHLMKMLHSSGDWTRRESAPASGSSDHRNRD